MADLSTPLTALCNICHSAAPKYTCPRDKVRTCSLACSQSHKRRAACNGQRDPSAYVPKSTLATAGGIDRDYNFLTGVERSIDRADKETSERGVSLTGQGKAGFEKRWHDKGALARYLRDHGIVVHKAPIGMARQKANQTRFIQKSKRIVWSVEWVVDGEKRVAEVDEGRTMEQAYKDLVAEKERENKKRKRASEEAGAKAQKQKTRLEKPEIAETTMQTREGATVQPPAQSEEGATAEHQNMPETEGPTQEAAKQEAPEEAPTNDTTKPPSLENEPSTADTPNFYLHKPHTSSKNTVLIPLPPSTTLTASLAQKDVLEFPTIYVFNTSKPPSAHDATKEQEETRPALPTGFVTLEEYKWEKAAEEEELKGLMEAIPQGQRDVALQSGVFAGQGEKREEVDEKQVLEVLKRDVDALGR